MDKIDELLTRGVAEIYPSQEALETALRSGKKLRLYQGFDPTTPQLHLGHMVGLRKLRQFQQQEHTVIFLIGDFTAQIGDPSDKSAARVRLSKNEVKENLKTFSKQAGLFLSFTDQKNPALVRFNSQWLSRLSFADIIELAANFTVQQMMERDMFSKRLRENKPIYLHEFLYPLMQGYDCVAMDVDLEIGGTDQTFNMLAGRTLMRQMKDKEKFVLTTKLLTDTTGQKMGKTTGNYVSLTDKPNEVFAKVMSFSDTFLPSFIESLTDMPVDTPLRGPLNVKKQVAADIVRQLHGAQAARTAQEHFERVVQKGELPDQKSPLPSSSTPISLTEYLVHHELVGSKSAARRLIKQGGLKINSQTITNPEHKIAPIPGTIIQVGKHTVVEVVEGP